MTWGNDIRALCTLFRLQLRNAAALRASFGIQAFGMAVNNLGILLAWMLFAQTFGSLNGWSANDVIGLQGIGTLSYGIAYTFFHGAAVFRFDIERGVFDAHLLRPRRLMLLVWRSSLSTTAFGDGIYGLVILAIASVATHLPWVTFLLGVVLSIPSAMILVSMSTIFGALAFWHPEDRTTGDMGYRMFIVPTMFPAGAFPYAARIFFTVILPSLLAGAWEWDAARSLSPVLFLLSWLAGFGWLGVAALVFHMGLRRYESGGTGA